MVGLPPESALDDVEGPPVFLEDFGKGLGPAWEPYGVIGGDWQAFAKVGPSRMAVRVPAGHSWGKTGIMSKDPFLTLDERPVRVQVELDPAETTGVCVAFSQAKDYDIWRQQNIWLTWAKSSDTEGGAFFGNTQNGGEQFGGFKTALPAPKTISVTFQPGQAMLSLAGGKKAVQKFSWLKPGTKLYFTVFSHPASEYAAVDLTVKSIKVYK